MRKRIFLLMAPIAFLLFGFQSKTALSPAVVVRGTIVSEDTDAPVANAHVYIVQGEEESLSNSRGEFRIESWQKAPYRLTIDQPDHQRLTVSVTDPGRKLVIRIKHK